MVGIHRALHRASSSIEPAASPTVRRAIGPELQGIAEAVRARNPRLSRDRMRRHVRKFAFAEIEREFQAREAEA